VTADDSVVRGTAQSDPFASWFFIVGTGRCGSSVFHELIARHEDVGFISNVEDRFPLARPLGRWNNSLYRAVPPAMTRKGRPRFAPSEGYRLLDAEVSPALSRPVRDLTAEDLTPWLAQRLRSSMTRHAARQATATFSHKFTGWPRTGLLAEAFPGCRFVHVVRDGRAVANSLLQMPWWSGYQGPGAWRYGPLPQPYAELWDRSGRSFPVLAGLTWRLLMDAYVQAERAAEPERWLTVRYEDVLAKPREHFERILQHVGLPWSARFEAGLRRHPLRGGRAEGFRHDLHPRDIEAIEQATGPMLELWGYL
jgi:hypothetical protein